jgi:hypothetical protein
VVRFYDPDAVMDMTRTIGLAQKGRRQSAASMKTGSANYEEYEIEIVDVQSLGHGIFHAGRIDGRPSGVRPGEASAIWGSPPDARLYHWHGDLGA